MEYVGIELNGLPGSGKTTLLNNLNPQIKKYFNSEKEFYSCLNNPLGRFYSLKFCFAGNICADIKLLFNIQKHAIAGRKIFALQKTLKLLRFKGIFNQKRCSHLLSEGYLQIVAEILDFLAIENLTKDSYFYKYVIEDIITLNKLYFILIKVPVSVALNRVANRNLLSNTIDSMHEEERKLFLLKRFSNNDSLQKLVLNKIPLNRVLVIDGEDSVEKKVIQLSEFLVTIIRNGKE